jgi:hypothetical protein
MADLAYNDIAKLLKAYAGCISASNGRSDCAAEVKQVRSAQDTWQTAVRHHLKYRPS